MQRILRQLLQFSYGASLLPEKYSAEWQGILYEFYYRIAIAKKAKKALMKPEPFFDLPEM